MQQHTDLSPARINDDLLRFVLGPPPRWFWFAAGGLALLAASGLGTIGLLGVYGLGLLGYTNQELWSVPITTFVYLVGISHAGVMISAVLRLSHAEWRRPITRAAEVLTIFSLAIAALFPIIHTGRPWRTLYWSFPYDFSRNIWPSIRSPLIWDATSLLVYLAATILFVYFALLPDLAVLRDRTSGTRHRFYRALALGFRGTSRQWRLQGYASVLLAALLLPVFVSVHSTVASNFSMTVVPGWHSTLLGPYYVMSAIHSGMAAVVTIAVLLRWGLNLQDYITPEHLDVLGRLQVAVALGLIFLFVVEMTVGIFGREPLDLEIWRLELLTPPYAWFTLVFFLTALLIPLPLWLFRAVRRHAGLMLALSLLVNVGMWLERYLLVVTPLSHKSAFVFTWVTDLQLQPLDYVLVVASVAAVLLGVLLFAKVFPIVPLYDVKEGQTVRRSVRFGRLRVPAVIRE